MTHQIKKLPTQEKQPYTVLTQGKFIKTDYTSYFEPPKPKKWIYVAGRALALNGAISFISFSFLWAADGSWNIATIFFMLGLFFCIPFILFGRELKQLKNMEQISDSLVKN
jgi:hypothetical protein